MSRLIAATLAVFLSFTIAMPALAATVGLVRGTVTLNGKAVAGATLTLEGEGSSFTAQSDAKGDYVLSAVPFGTYRLRVSAGKAALYQTVVTVSSDTVTAIDVPLSPPGLEQIGKTGVVASGGASGNPVAVNVLDKSQIQDSPVQNSLNRTIETLPGIVQFSYNEPVANGFHGILYELDGSPLPLATSSNFAEIIDPRDIDSLEVFTGAIPAEFGGDRMGAVVNIISDRPTDIPEGFYGLLSGGFGNQAQGVGSLDISSRFGSTDAFLNLNTQSANRGLDAPTFIPINDATSSNDQFARLITQVNPRATLSFDYASGFSQFEIPINTDPNNPNDPITSVPGTLDTQLEYSRFSNLSFTQTSKDGNGIVQISPWWRSARIDYNGNLAADVLGMQPNFGCPTFPTCAAPYPQALNSVGLEQHTDANYVGLNVSDFRATLHHAWKVGIQTDRENATANQIFACYYVDCNVPGPQGDGTTPVVASPYYASMPAAQAQAGTNTGVYGEDKWSPTQNLVFSGGLRYDHSTGYVGGWQLSPRLGMNVSDDGGRNVMHVYYGRFYAAPQLEDVRSACVVFAAQQACPSTSPVYDLQPERDAYYEIGYAHQYNSALTGSVNIFQKSVVNVLDTTQFLNTPLFAVYNNAIGIDHGLEVRLQHHPLGGDQWSISGTVSGSYAGGISGSTFLFPPNINGNIPLTSPAQLGVEDHDETVVSTGTYTHPFGPQQMDFATLQADYGSGFPVQFQDANVNLNGRLPTHLTFDLAAGRNLIAGKGPQGHGLGVQLLVNNLLNHQYVIKVANGFNTTQIADGRTFLLKLTVPF
jgi:outer membrane receptor protein involved in Fe transport